MDLREEAPGVYTVVVEEDGERRIFRVVARNGVLSTPWGSYHVSELRRKTQPHMHRRREWLVEVSGGVIRVRLPVRVVEVFVGRGSRVEKGEAIAVVETMKMLNEVSAPCSGVVEEVAEPGKGLEAGAVLARIKCG